MLQHQHTDDSKWLVGSKDEFPAISFSGWETKDTVSTATVPVEGFQCIGTPNAYVVRPSDDKAYPLLSFVHGGGSGGDKLVKQWYADLLKTVAGKGFTVVAMEAGEGEDALGCA